MQVLTGVLGAAAATGTVLAVGSGFARWACGVAVHMPRVPMAAIAAATGFVAGGRLELEAALAAFVVLAVGTAVLVGIDVRLHRLPDRLTLGTTAAGFILLAVAAGLTGEWPRLGRAALAAAVLFAVYLGLFLLVGNGLGAGDVKLATALGLYLGWLSWPTLAIGGFAGFGAKLISSPFDDLQITSADANPRVRIAMTGEQLQQLVESRSEFRYERQVAQGPATTPRG